MSKKIIVGVIVIATTIGVGKIMIDRASARVTVTPPESPAETVIETATSRVDGIVTAVKGNKLIVDVKGVSESFIVPKTCEITKDRRPAKLAALIPGDRVSIKPAGSGDELIAVAISAFGVE